MTHLVCLRIQERAGHASKVMTFARYSHAPKRDTDRIRRTLSVARTPASTGGMRHLRVVRDDETG
jgi:integrase